LILPTLEGVVDFGKLMLLKGDKFQSKQNRRPNECGYICSRELLSPD